MDDSAKKGIMSDMRAAGRGTPSGMIEEELFSEDLVLMASPNHALARGQGVRKRRSCHC